jgi:hypothetical protein
MEYRAESDVILIQRANAGVTLRTTRKINTNHFVMMLSVHKSAQQLIDEFPICLKSAFLDLSSYHFLGLLSINLLTVFRTFCNSGTTLRYQTTDFGHKNKIQPVQIFRCYNENHSGKLRLQILTR